MYACICHAVTENEVIDAVDAGADCVESVGDATFAGTGCGMCHERLEAIVSARCGECPLAALAVA